MSNRIYLERLLLHRAGAIVLTLVFLNAFIFTSIIFSAENKSSKKSAEKTIHTDVDDSAATTEEFTLLKGDLKTLKVSNLKRVSIVDPSVADISNAETNEILLIGNEPGQTVMFVWDDSGKRNVIIRVFSDDLTAVRYRLEKLLEQADIKEVKVAENPYEGKLVLTGELSDERKEELSKLMAPFSANILDLIKGEAKDDLVQIDMQITEVNTSIAQTLGIEWDNVTGSGEGLLLGYKEGPIEDKGNINDLFRVGTPFTRTTGLLASIDALIVQGKARILSKPRLVVRSGKQATFLVGGEVPIRSTTVSSGGSNLTENVTFRSYGVSMSITPTIRNEKVDIEMNVEVSDIDEANASGGNVAFLTRSAQTTLYLDNNQTVVLAGLIKKRDSENTKKVRLLGSIPILGLLFRSKDVPKSEVELVISLTPTIVRTSRNTDEQKTKSDPNTAFMQDGIRTDLLADDEKAVGKNKKKHGGPLISKNLISSNGVSVPEEMSPYIRSIQEKICSGISYPFEAQENGWEGIVKLRLQILKDGTLGSSAVKESSGYDIFDNDALHTAQTVAPYSPFPPELSLEELNVTIPIIYSHSSFFQNTAKSSQ